jgi:sulfofructose kinase
LPGWICVTDGDKGAFWLEGKRLHRAPACRVEAVDTLAAGDVWHGAFALRLAEGAHEADAIRFAHAAAAIKCTRFGGRNGSPRRDEVTKFMAEASNCN